MQAIEDVDGRLVWTATDTPIAVGPGEVRIRVAATAVNRADLVQRSGRYRPPPGASPILGLECSGIVDQIGEGVSWPVIGEEVCALLSSGGYAEQVVVPAAHVLPIPAGMTLLEAAALPEVFTTAWLNLRREGELAMAESRSPVGGREAVGEAS